MSTQALPGALADDRRRLVFAAVTLGDGDVPTVAARTGLSARDVATAVRRMIDAGLVTDTGSGLRVDGKRLRELARAGADKLEAGYDNGVLTLRIPIAERAKPRRISITAPANGTGRKQINA